MKGTLGYRLRTIICPGCGRSVTGRLRPAQRFCSPDCYRTAARPERKTGETKNCAVCDAEIYIPRCRLGRAVYFCGTEHANQWQGRNKTEHVCKICGRCFRWSPSRQKANNITYCSPACRDADPARREMLIGMNYRQQLVSPTTPERIGYSLLDALGVTYQRQHLIGGKFCVDAFLPDAGAVIQFDGDYWHGHPARFPEPDRRQKTRMRLDRSQDAYLAACGYRVIRIWESDLKHNAEAVKARLLALLTAGEHAPAVPATGPLGA